MTTKFDNYAKVLYVLQLSCWTWYSDQVANVKTPEHSMTDALAKTQGKWMADSHLQGIVNDSFYRRDCLAYMEIKAGPSVMNGHVVEFSWTLLGHRCWSMAVRHHAPPNVYMGLKSQDPEQRKAAANLMKRHWERLMALEQRSLDYEPAKMLCEPLIIIKYSAVRLMFVTYERDLFRWDSEAGAYYFTGLVYVLPDNKIVEDCHNTMKADAKKTGRSGKRKNITLQDSLQNSKVFENRKINHAAKVSRDYFLAKYKATKMNRKFAKRYRAKNHKLPSEWKKITSRKTWKTFSEDSFRKDIAA